MGVYIDSFNAPFRRMVMCHMIADTHDELVEMAEKIGVNVKWIQDAGTQHEHFDVCLQKKALALKFGAEEVSLRTMAEKLTARDRPEVFAKYFGINQPDQLKVRGQ